MDLVSLHLLDGAGFEEMPRAWPAQIAVGVLLIVAVFVALTPLALPPALASIAPERDFATGRAMRHFDAVARAFEPGEAAAVAGGQLSALGLRVTALPGAPGGDVLARLPGMNPSGAILLAARCGPGAEAPGTLAVIEAIRALTAGPRPKNDVVVLLAGGPEPIPPLDADPATRGVAVVLALAGTGATGPSAVLAAGPGSGPLVARAASAAPHPLLLLTLNDLPARGGAVAPWALGLLDQGRAGIVFGPFSGRPAERPDLSTMQDDGATVLALLRQLGDEPLAAPGAPAAKETLALHAGPRLFLYPAAWSRPLAVASALLAGALLALGLVRKRLSAGGLLLGLVALLGTIVLSSLLGTAAGAIGRAVRPSGGVPALFSSLSAIFAAAVALGVDAVVRRGKAAAAPLASAGLVAWALASLVAGFSFPALSTLLVWPLLLLAPAFLVLFLLHEPARHPWLRAAALAVAAVPAILVATPPFALVSGLVTAGRASVLLPGALAGFFFAALFALLPHAPRRRAS